jgi:plasmid stabilization system protein ParE
VGKSRRFAVMRFYFSPEASADLDEIQHYLDEIPRQHVVPIRRGLQNLIREIASHPDRGASHSQATLIFGFEVRTRVVIPYRIFYRDNRGIPEIIAVLHTARDIRSILSKRVQ